MNDFDILPHNWKDKAVSLDDLESKRYQFLGNGVWVDDDCPMELSILVIDQSEVFRITDQMDTLLILKALNFSPVIADLYSKRIPELGKLEENIVSIN